MQELQGGDPRRIGPYRLVGRLGAGGMGMVFAARSAGGRAVAVKVIRSELAGDAEFRVRFSREVTAARSVSGLFTAPVVDADVDGPMPWLATAYVPGPSGGDSSCRPATSYAAHRSLFPAPQLPCWSLIARIGDGQPFEVGTSILVSATTGRLYLGVNDDSFSGNAGIWTAKIKIGGLP